jgi:antitoxin component of RelBE/YafQ-DinJ toxin-antitoxin module
VILNTKVRPSVRAQIQQIATTQYGISPSCLMRLLLSCYLKDQKLRMLFDASIASRAYLLESYHKYLT